MENIVSGSLNAVEPILDAVDVGSVIATGGVGKIALPVLKKGVKEGLEKVGVELVPKITNKKISDYTDDEIMSILYNYGDSTDMYYAAMLPIEDLRESLSSEYINRLIGNNVKKSGYKLKIKPESFLGKVDKNINSNIEKVKTNVGKSFQKDVNIDSESLEKLIKENLNKEGINEDKLKISISNNKNKKGLTIHTIQPQQIKYIEDINNNLISMETIPKIEGNIDLTKNFKKTTGIKPIDNLIDKYIEIPGYDKRFKNFQGLKKAQDYPNVKNIKGAAPIIHNSINQYLKDNNLGNLLSGGTGHSEEGYKRWKKLLDRGIADFVDKDKNLYYLKEKGGEIKLTKYKK